MIKMAVQKEPQRDSDYLDLSLSVSFSFSVLVDEVGVIHFLNLILRKKNKNPEFCSETNLNNLYVNSDIQIHT